MTANKRTKKFLKAASKAGGSIKALKKGRKRLRVDKGDSIVDEPLENESNAKSAVQRHRDEILALKERDPEFFSFLEQNDQEALQFGEDDDDNEDDDFDEGGEDIDDNGSQDDGMDKDDLDNLKTSRGKSRRDKLTAAPTVAVEVNESILSNVLENARQGVFSSIKKMISIFRAACIPANGEDDEDFDETSDKVVNNKYSVTTPEIYNLVMVGILETAHDGFQNFLGPDLSIVDKSVKDHPKWKKLQTMLLSFFKCLLHTLEGLAVGKKEEQATMFITTSLESYVPFLVHMPRVSKSLLKLLLDIWSQWSPSATSNAVDVRGNAFLRIRQIASLPGEFSEDCFRSLYLTYARTCKTYTELSAPSTLLMIECIVTLYGSDVQLAYQQGFLYIRQLALHLRATVLKKTAENTQQISSWQYLNCIRLWTRVICSMPDSTRLGPLAFPLVQIIFGVISTLPSLYLLPLRFHLIACLHQISACCQVFIPTAPKLLEVLENEDLVGGKPSPSTEVAPILAFSIKFPTDSINRATVRDLIVSETIALLRADADIYRYNLGFPEYCYFTIRKLRQFAKKSKVGKWRDMSKAVVGQLEERAASVEKERRGLKTSPAAAAAEFEPLLPFGAETAPKRLDRQASLKEASLNVSSGGSGSGNNKGGKDQNGNDLAGAATKLTDGKKNRKQKRDTLEGQVSSRAAATSERKTVAKTAGKNSNISTPKKSNEPHRADLADEVNDFTWSDDEDD